MNVLINICMEVIDFNEAGAVEMATAYGTLKTRILILELDILSMEGNITLGSLHRMLLEKWGFDLSDLIEIRFEPSIRRITLSQKWWDRSQRKPNNEYIV